MTQGKLTLTQTASISKKTAAVAVVLILIIYIIRASLPKIRMFTARLFPPKEVAPLTIYGQLPPLSIPGFEVEGGPIYTIETVTGRLPSFDSKVTVLRMSKPKYSYLSGARLKSNAALLGFEGNPNKSESGGSVQIWTNEQRQATLSANLITEQFKIDSNMNLAQERFPKGTAPTNLEAQQFVVNLFNSLLPKPPPEYIKGRVQTQFMQVITGEFYYVDNSFEAELTKIDIFRDIIINNQKFPVVTITPKEGLISFLLGKNSSGKLEIVKASYNPWKIETEGQLATYPLRSVSDAWSEVAQKKAATVALTEIKENPKRLTASGPLSRIDIYRVYLGYLDFFEYQDFLQPIYIFEGTGLTKDRSRQVEFVAYAGAVENEWYAK